MKKTLMAMSLAAVCGASLAGNPVAVSGTVNVTSSSGASSFVDGTGTSVSYASNNQTAITGVATSQDTAVQNCTKTTTTSADLAAGTIVTSHSTASNVSTGTGTGSADATGYSLVGISGSVTPHTKNGVSASVDGGVNAVSQTGVSAGQNQTGHASGFVATGFIATANAGTSTGKFDGIQITSNNAETNVLTGTIANNTSVGNTTNLVNVSGGSYGNANSASNSVISQK